MPGDLSQDLHSQAFRFYRDNDFVELFHQLLAGTA